MTIVPNEQILDMLEEYERERNGRGVQWGRCFCGCKARVPSAKRTRTPFGVVRFHPAKYLHNHHVRLTPFPYKIDEETGCWIWQWSTHGKEPHVYGRARQGNRNVEAHRLYYEKKYGSIPPKMTIHHRCVEEGFGTTLCVNPDHLKPLSPSDHSRLHAVRIERWSRGYDCCIACGTTERRHYARGMCQLCQERVRNGVRNPRRKDVPLP